MIHEVVAIMAAPSTAESAGAAIHAYPARSESVKAAPLGIREQVG